MTIEILVYPGLVFLAVALIAKLIERRNDVLYGPYIQGRKSTRANMRDRLDAVMASIGLRRDYGRMTVKFAAMSIFASAIIG
jgi:hypothetical protein